MEYTKRVSRSTHNNIEHTATQHIPIMHILRELSTLTIEWRTKAKNGERNIRREKNGERSFGLRSGKTSTYLWKLWKRCGRMDERRRLRDFQVFRLRMATTDVLIFTSLYNSISIINAKPFCLSCYSIVSRLALDGRFFESNFFLILASASENHFAMLLQ